MVWNLIRSIWVLLNSARRTRKTVALSFWWEAHLSYFKLLTSWNVSPGFISMIFIGPLWFYSDSFYFSHGFTAMVLTLTCGFTAMVLALPCGFTVMVLTLTDVVLKPVITRRQGTLAESSPFSPLQFVILMASVYIKLCVSPLSKELGNHSLLPVLHLLNDLIRSVLTQQKPTFCFLDWY